MIKITNNDFKLFYKEFKKGNVYHMTIPKIKTDYSSNEIIFVKEIFESRRKINFSSYMTKVKRFGISGISAPYSKWNWNDFDFYILTKKEASPYIKKMIVAQLGEEEQ